MRPILIVEDDPGLVDLARETLREARLENPVHHAASGRLAMERMSGLAAAGDLPALVLLDLRVPSPNGYDVLAAFKANPLWREVPVVAISRFRGEKDLKRAYDLGAGAYIHNSGDFLALARSLEAAGIFWATVNVLPSCRRPAELTVTEGIDLQMRFEEAMAAVYLHLSFNPAQPPNLKAFWCDASADEMNHMAILKLERSLIRDLGTDGPLGAGVAERIIRQNDEVLPSLDVIKASRLSAREAILWSIELELGEVNCLYHVLLRLPEVAKLWCLDRLLVNEDQHLSSFEAVARQYGVEAGGQIAEMKRRLAGVGPVEGGQGPRPGSAPQEG
jgi:two-component system response regulator